MYYDFEYGDIMEINHPDGWTFELGKFKPIINGVCVPVACKVCFETVFGNSPRLVLYDRNGDAVAYITGEASERWKISYSIYPKYFMYDLKIDLISVA